jgi:4-hydroxythreonine-4-phosphate dehydrogenase
VDAHKIDSTLRGNWDAEVMAYVRSGRRVLMVPSHPAAGRTCSGGIVRVNGVPVHESEHGDDLRSMTRTSRPSTVLSDSVEITGSEVRRWVADPRGPAVAVADATTVGELEMVIDAVASQDPAVMVCGPSAAIRALASRRSPQHGVARSAAGCPVLRLPVLVVVGSRHPVSRAQVAALASTNASVTVLSTDPGEETDPEDAASALASKAHSALAAQRFATVVLVGGDTAGAFLGDRSVHVFGSLELGVAQGVAVMDGVEVAVVAKPGAFGDETTLVRLIAEMSP